MHGFGDAVALPIFAITITCTIYCVLKEPLIPHLKWHVKYYWVPMLGVVGMLMCTSMSFGDVWRGLKGDSHIQPYGILILFMALAYIAASVDASGVFGWLALHITRMSGGRGHALFGLYFALSSVLTMFTSNDVSIMTLTPIILYFAAATRANPMPYLLAEFAAANLWSMALFVGNPTNIIVAQAYKMSFVGYSKWMLLPTLAAGLVALLQLYLTHRHHLPIQLQLPPIEPSELLADKRGAIAGCANLSICLVLLAACPSLKWDMWLVSLICALFHACYNFIAMVVYEGRIGRRALWLASRGGNHRRRHNAAAALRQLAPYAASSPDEETADAILTNDDLAAYYRMKRVPKQSFLSSLASKLQHAAAARHTGSSSTGVGAMAGLSSGISGALSGTSPTKGGWLSGWRASEERTRLLQHSGTFQHRPRDGEGPPPTSLAALLGNALGAPSSPRHNSTPPVGPTFSTSSGITASTYPSMGSGWWDAVNGAGPSNMAAPASTDGPTSIALSVVKEREVQDSADATAVPLQQPAGEGRSMGSVVRKSGRPGHKGRSYSWATGLENILGGVEDPVQAAVEGLVDEDVAEASRLLGSTALLSDQPSGNRPASPVKQTLKGMLGGVWGGLGGGRRSRRGSGTNTSLTRCDSEEDELLLAGDARSEGQPGGGSLGRERSSEWLLGGSPAAAAHHLPSLPPPPPYSEHEQYDSVPAAAWSNGAAGDMALVSLRRAASPPVTAPHTIQILTAIGSPVGRTPAVAQPLAVAPASVDTPQSAPPKLPSVSTSQPVTPFAAAAPPTSPGSLGPRAMVRASSFGHASSLTGARSAGSSMSRLSSSGATAGSGSLLGTAGSWQLQQQTQPAAPVHAAQVLQGGAAHGVPVPFASLLPSLPEHAEASHVHHAGPLQPRPASAGRPRTAPAPAARAPPTTTAHAHNPRTHFRPYTPTTHPHSHMAVAPPIGPVFASGPSALLLPNASELGAARQALRMDLAAARGSSQALNHSSPRAPHHSRHSSNGSVTSTSTNNMLTSPRSPIANAAGGLGLARWGLSGGTFARAPSPPAPSTSGRGWLASAGPVSAKPVGRNEAPPALRPNKSGRLLRSRSAQDILAAAGGQGAGAGRAVVGSGLAGPQPQPRGTTTTTSNNNKRPGNDQSGLRHEASAASLGARSARSGLGSNVSSSSSLDGDSEIEVEVEEEGGQGGVVAVVVRRPKAILRATTPPPDVPPPPYSEHRQHDTVLCDTLGEAVGWQAAESTAVQVPLRPVRTSLPVGMGAAGAGGRQSGSATWQASNSSADTAPGSRRAASAELRRAGLRQPDRAHHHHMTYGCTADLTCDPLDVEIGLCSAGEHGTLGGFSSLGQEGGEAAGDGAGGDGQEEVHDTGDEGGKWTEGMEWGTLLTPPSRSFTHTVTCLPWEVVPFVLGMFVLVEGLRVSGWVAWMARGLGRGAARGGVGGTLFLFGWLSVGLANLVNNQPQTILLTTVCLDPAFAEKARAWHSGGSSIHDLLPPSSAAPYFNGTTLAVAPPTSPLVDDGGVGRDMGGGRVQHAALLAVVVGSNVGALFTIMGALAGIMWANILKRFHLHMSYVDFLMAMAPVGLTTTLVVLLVLWAEYAWSA